MSRPRRIVPGATHFVTRRCAHRAFRLRPSERTNRIYKYALAFAAQKTGVIVHAVCVMSDHHHLVVTDVHATLPIFVRELHRMIAKALNAAQGQWENLWSAEATNVAEIGDARDAEETIAYVVANPVKAGLVTTPEEWPGVLLWGNRDIVVVRPDDYFAPDGNAPSSLVLRIRQPGSIGGWPFDANRLRRAIAEKVAAARRAVFAAGRSFLGRAAVLATSFLACAKSYEVKRRMVSSVAAADPETRLRLLRTRNAFLAAYREALRAWCDGIRSAVFPFGTWWMRVHHRAEVLSEAFESRAPSA